MLLYIGACTDLRPLMRFAHSHKEFVYVDGLPDSKYFKYRSPTIDTLCEEMIDQLKRERAYENHEMKEDHFIIHTVGGQTLFYFYNTLDVDMFKKKGLLSELLQKVTALYMCGYSPTITENLPALKTMIYTELCSPYSEDTTLAFDWKSKEKIVVPEFQTNWEPFKNEGGLTGFYISGCYECDSTVQMFEEFWHGE